MTELASDAVMAVVRVHTEHGSHIEPPLRQEWGDLTKLRWHAAVMTADTGVEVLVHPMQRRYHRTEYSVQLGRGSHSSRPFHEAWMLISDAASGAEALLDLLEPGPDAARWSPDTEENP